MTTASFQKVTIGGRARLSVQQAWDIWTSPSHITKWNAAQPEWHSPSATNDLRPGGEFNFRMEARDGSMGFDFSGVYDDVIPEKHLAYTLGDGRKVTVDFIEREGQVEIIETFDAETENPVDFQQQGWQAILDSFIQYAESQTS